MTQDQRSDGDERSRLPEGIDLSDFDAIEAAVSETVRGRWFLAEYARRLRAQDTGRILSVLTRMEERHILSGEAGLAGEARLLAGGIAERLSDMAWALRERGLPEDMCRLIEREASAVAALGGAGVEQGALMARDVTAAPKAATTPAPAQPVAFSGWDFARLDALSADDKVRLFA